MYNNSPENDKPIAQELTMVDLQEMGLTPEEFYNLAQADKVAGIYLEDTIDE